MRKLHFLTLPRRNSVCNVFKVSSSLLNNESRKCYTSSISLRSFLYEPPEEISTDLPLEFVTPKEVMPLLHAIQLNKKLDAWNIYRDLNNARKLHLLSPIQHSIVLKFYDIRKLPKNPLNMKLFTFKLHYIFRHMKLAGHQPNIIDYTHMLNVFSRIRYSKICEDLWVESSRRGITPTIYMYNSYLASCLHREKPLLKKANYIVEKLKKSGLKANLTTYSLLVRLHCYTQNFEAAQKILDAKFDLQKNLDASSHWELRYHVWAIVRALRSMISAYGYKGDLSAMDNCYRILKFYDKPDIQLFNILIRNSCNQSNIQRGQQYFNEMVSYNIKPDIHVLRRLIRCLCNKGKTRASCELLETTKEKYNLTPSDYILATIHKTMVKKRRIKDANEFADKWKIPASWLEKNKSLHNNLKGSSAKMDIL
ncbi:10869_t:CDS:1 [Acaulospora morrowiae]|uniref:10869_t:CDS:1 n=1 Tax=Acaulospora morrowiae TaxID=94023 RepID=A0A9N8WER5_9GLOM|nr:10869_t:CDS:1 [Acaulospora morrowiae]